MSSMITEGLKC